MSHRQKLRFQSSWIKEVISNPCLACIIRQRWYFEEDETRHALLWKRNVGEAFILVAWYRKASVFCWWWRQCTRRGKSDVTNSRIKLLAAYMWPRSSPQLLCDPCWVWFPNYKHKVTPVLIEEWHSTRCRILIFLSLPSLPFHVQQSSPPPHHRAFLFFPFRVYLSGPRVFLLQLSSTLPPRYVFVYNYILKHWLPARAPGELSHCPYV